MLDSNNQNNDQLINSLQERLKKISSNLTDLPTSKKTTFALQCIENILTVYDNNPGYKDRKLIENALNELVNSFLIFKNYQNDRKVAIFGSARTPEDNPNFALAEQTAKLLTEAGFFIITGAGPGIMEAGNKGAVNNHHFGLHINLPFEQTPNKYIAESKNMIPYNYFFTRKLAFVKESDAIVLFPGGFGTLDEGFEVLTLIQTGCCSPRPFIIINKPDSSYWTHWKEYVTQQLLDRHYISPEDINIIQEINDPKDICDTIKKFYSVYHSIKYFNSVAYMRINKALSKKTLKMLHEKYASVLTKGTFELHPHSVIAEETDIYPEKLRLVFHFNHLNYGTLTEMIHFINDVG